MDREALSICVVSRVMPAHGSGGMQLHTRQVARGLARRGHAVRVITAAHPGGGGARSERDGDVTVHYAPSAPARWYTPRWWRECSALFRRLHGEHRFRVIVSADAGAFPLLSMRRRGEAVPPCVMIRHGTALREIRAGLGSRSPRKLLTLPLHLYLYVAHGRRLLPLVDAMIAVSSAVRDEALREASVEPDRIVVVPNGVDTELFAPAPDAVAAEEPLHLVAAGRVIPEKGLDVLVHAAASLAREGLRLKVSIAGEGRARSSLQELGRRLGLQGLSFVGELDRDRLPAFYRGGDVLVVPSRRDEGLPLVILEAMACGLPIVASTAGGSGVEVAESDAFRLFAHDDPDELARCVRRLHALSPGRRRELGAANRRLVVERHSLDAMLDETERIVMATADGGAPVGHA